MIVLSNTASLLQLITGGSQAVHVHVSWLDATGTTISLDALNSQFSGAGTETICASPTAFVERDIEFVSIYNADPTNPIDITVLHYDGTTTSILHQTFSLIAGAALFYEDQRGWYVLVDGAEAFVSPP